MGVARAFRWLLVPVAALGAWGASILFGLLLHGAATSVCPDSEMVSGACVAPWWPYADAVVVFVAAAFAAASIVLACALTAPAHRPQVAVVVYVIGAVYAVILAIAGAAYVALPSAGGSGAWAVWWVRKRYR